jgi:putative transcriptional regulator
MKMQDLMRGEKISSSGATKLNKNETDVIMRIRKEFHCDIGDVCEVILDE